MKLKLFTLLQVIEDKLLEKDSKVHLAGYTGEWHPIDSYLAGSFDEFQSWQTKANFERKYIVALIQLSKPNKWLFAGAFYSQGYEYHEDGNLYKYKTTEMELLKQFSGRVVVDFQRSGRQSYLNAENWTDTMFISEIYAERMVVEEFKSYNYTSISKKTLDIIVQQDVISWKSALSAVCGVYLITDKAIGKLYVGSATGNGGFWQRWSQYSFDGHGGNIELRKLVKQKGIEYVNQNFQYSIIETVDNHTNEEDIRKRESYWKNVLLSRDFGYNSN